MLLNDDKKKMAATIIANVSKKGEPSKEAPMSEDGAESDDSVGMESAAEEMLQAIEAKSAKGIVEAFKSMYEMYDQQEEPQEQESPQE